MNDTGYIVFAHGSRLESANDAVREVTRKMAAQGQFTAVETAFLELGKPDLSDAVEALLGKGTTQIVVMPYFLTTGMHLTRDLPQLVEAVLARHPDLRIQVTPPLDGHPAMVDVLIGRAREADEKRHAGQTA